MTETPCTVLVVIVNYRCADLTVDCLASLEGEAAALPGLSVTVVDNASGDGSVLQLAETIRDRGWADWVTLLPSNTNGGFAHGNNAAIVPALASASPPRHFLLLNPDTIVRPGAVSALVDFMDRHPEVGIAGSRLENPDGTPQRSAFRFHSVLGQLENGMRLGVVTRLLSRSVVAPPPPADAAPSDWVSGASMIVRREVFDAIGVMDDRYFLYFEETDFCLQAHRAGWTCWYVPDSRVVHLVGQTTGIAALAETRKRMPAYWFRSRRHYFHKNHGIATAILADLVWATSYASFRVRRVLQRKPDHDPHRLFRDFLCHSFVPKSLVRSRRPAPNRPVSADVGRNSYIETRSVSRS